MGCAREEAPVPMLYANPMMSLTPGQVWHSAPPIGEDTTSMRSWASQMRTSLNSTSKTWSIGTEPFASPQFEAIHP